MMMQMEETTKPMLSANYKDRFIAEYVQTKIRYERLKAFNVKIEAAHRTEHLADKEGAIVVAMPPHDCPDHLLLDQQRVMGDYLHTLEVRAVIEGIDLSSL